MGLLGVGSFGAGVLAVFVTENGTGAAVLLAFGGLMLVLALLGDRLESLEFGGAGLKLRAAAAERFALAEESERRGETAMADQLREEAQILMGAAKPLADNYRSVRSSMSPGPERTRAMEEVVAQARRLASEASFEPTAVLRWLREGTDGERITALALMQAKSELRHFEAVLAAVEVPRSAFEQYHAMRLLRDMITDLDPPQLRQVAEVVRSQRGASLDSDTGRARLGEDILRRVDGLVSTVDTRDRRA